MNFDRTEQSYGSSLRDVPVSTGVLESLISLATDLVKLQHEIATTACGTADRVLGPRPETCDSVDKEPPPYGAVDNLRQRLMHANAAAHAALSQVRRFGDL